MWRIFFASMAGIYIHIPFCKVKCHYCDFHFSTQLKNKSAVLNAISKEIELKSNYLEDNEVNTIYFGGGTPSLLSKPELQEIFDVIRDKNNVHEEAEITLECNPDDLNKEKLNDFLSIGINRLSIGTQSFDDEVLNYMNRAHSSKEALNSIYWAKEAGFENITLDLIYGIPEKSLDYWKRQVDQFLSLEVPHLSAYCLTIEDNTAFGNWNKKGKLKLKSDENSIEEFQYLMDITNSHDYEQYEISNFCRPGYISKHNSSYWKGEPYLGIGPSAHSFKQQERRWNISNNIIYQKGIAEGKIIDEFEVLSFQDRYNEYILTRLRTKWGIDINELNKIHKNPELKVLLTGALKNGLLTNEGSIYYLTTKGKYMADSISADLFI